MRRQGQRHDYEVNANKLYARHYIRSKFSNEGDQIDYQRLFAVFSCL